MARSRAGQNGVNGAGGDGADLVDHVSVVSITEETRRRYLNYAMSVISSRALPDVRDGLKPVQRRILYAMYHDLRLTHDSKPRKSQKITGDTLGNYHPPGDTAVYEAMVRLAQDFCMRYPLIIGQGNFGSIMGLNAAAARYTEARLTELAERLMDELRFETVDMRPNYEATREEPVVLPAQFPHLLVNGTTGIAVGMATNIPPHNLNEVIKACIHLIENRKPGPDGQEPVTEAALMKAVSFKGPDFPLGGRIVTDRIEIRKAYEIGHGSVKVRGEWRFDTEKKKEVGTRLVIHSVPYNVWTGPLVEAIGGIVASRKLPQLLEVNDETNEELGLRIVLDIKSRDDAEAVMAYLYKHTDLESNFAINMTCLVPDEHGVMVPRRVGLVEMLRHFLTFRLATVRRRLEYQLRQLERRIHILEGFAIVFNDLTKALKIIRESDGKQDASQRLMRAFPLDEEQTMAILELQLYRIAQLEINRIMEELEEKRKEAARIRSILASEAKQWNVVEGELREVSEKFGDKRRTEIGSSEEIAEFDPTAYIVRENTNVVLTRDGWIKRVGRLTSVESTRVREGDAVIAVAPGSTLDTVIFFSSEGVAYTLPIDQVPASSGYGEPLSKHVKMGDGATILTGLSTDPRFTAEDFNVKNEPVPGPYLIIATKLGAIMRFSLSLLRAPSTKAGRKYCRLREGDRVVWVELIREADSIFLCSKHARLLHFPVKEVPVLANAGRGVRGIRIAPDDEVLGGALMSRPSDCLRVRNAGDKELSFGQMKYQLTSRGGKGVKTSARTGFVEILRPEIQLVDWAALEQG